MVELSKISAGHGLNHMKDTKAVKAENDSNRRIETDVFHAGIVAANTWITLVAPILIGFFITRLFDKDKFTISENTIFAVSIVLHVFFTITIYKASTRRSLSLEVDGLVEEIEHLQGTIIPRAAQLYDTSKVQQTVIYLMTLELENMIDELNEKAKLSTDEENIKRWDEGLNKILAPLVKYRHELFGYEGQDLYNICLYVYDIPNDNLIIKWRRFDDRLQPSNRSWKPGAGHVGLTFILNELKMCHDIYDSTELSNSALGPNDKAKYRSFLSVPVKDSSKVLTGGKPLGVLVFTSSARGQFSPDRDKLFALTAAKLVSIYVEKCLKSFVS